jgi:hypothetical protein
MIYSQALGHLYKSAQVNGSNQEVKLLHHVRPDPTFGQFFPFFWVEADKQEFSVFASELHNFKQ